MAGSTRRGRDGAWAILAALVVAGIILGRGRPGVAAESPAPPAPSAPSAPVPPPGMVWIPAGEYRPFFRSPEDAAVVAVRAFALDERPVTHGEFLAFVRDNPAWRRSAVKRLFADESYLAVVGGGFFEIGFEGAGVGAGDVGVVVRGAGLCAVGGSGCRRSRNGSTPPRGRGIRAAPWRCQGWAAGREGGGGGGAEWVLGPRREPAGVGVGDRLQHGDGDRGCAR